MLFLTNATVFTGTDWLTKATVRVDNDRIQELTTAPPGPVSSADTVVDLNEDFLLPGLIDLQLYGGSQLFLNEIPTPDTVRHIYDTHVRNGTTTLLPTIHSTSLDIMQQAIDAVAVVRNERPYGVPGIHVEGPYFNPIKRGAHSMAYVRTPAEGELETLFSRNADAIRILTLAPEILTPDQLGTIQRLMHPNTRLSLGHSNAMYAQATSAFNAGIPLSTHLYNAMRAYESREPGVVGAVFDHPSVRVSIIADGYHCDPVTIRIAHRLLGDRLFLISDALFASSPGRPAPRSQFTLGEFVVYLEPSSDSHDESTLGESTLGESTPGRYVNDAGNLAGSAITLLDCVRIAVNQAKIPLTDALRMATVIPANVLSMDHEIGMIQPGFVANMLHTSVHLRAKTVWTAGRQVT